MAMNNTKSVSDGLSKNCNATFVTEVLILNIICTRAHVTCNVQAENLGFIVNNAASYSGNPRQQPS
jgi:hypothetical protein